MSVYSGKKGGGSSSIANSNNSSSSNSNIPTTPIRKREDQQNTFSRWRDFASAPHPKKQQSLPFNKTLLYIVRHGQRLDESDFRAWNAIKTKKSWHDPPLTDLGHAMAAETATKLAAELKGMERLVTVYASPSVRTIGTAAPIAAAFGKPVILHNGLYCAAMPRTYGLAKCECAGPGDALFDMAAAAAGEHGVVHPALGDVAELDARAKVGGVDLFTETVSALVSAAAAAARTSNCDKGGGGLVGDRESVPHGGGHVVIIVAHREGFSFAKEKKEKIPYCGVGRWLVGGQAADAGGSRGGTADGKTVVSSCTDWVPCQPGAWRSRSE